MRYNKTQTVIGLICGIALLFLILLPPWQEAAERELSYRKDIGRGLLWKPPKTVAVDCYFVNCVTAPASYFHVVLKRKVLLQECLTVLGVAVAFLWIFRTRRTGQTSSVRSRGTRLLASFLLASLIPPAGEVPFGAGIVEIPKLLVRREELWLVPLIVVLVLYAACVLVIYGLLSLAVRFAASPSRLETERPS
jgi:hypothetical protein